MMAGARNEFSWGEFAASGPLGAAGGAIGFGLGKYVIAPAARAGGRAAAWFGGRLGVGPGIGGEIAGAAEGGACGAEAAESAVPAQLRAGIEHEAERIAELGVEKNTTTWRPTQADIDSAAFKVIVGKAKYTPDGLLKGTIIDVTQGGLREIKGGTSMLESSYQLRLQTYFALKNGLQYTIETSRPVNATFQGWLNRWDVQVVGPK
jgi:hypothetical protein